MERIESIVFIESIGANVEELSKLSKGGFILTHMQVLLSCFLQPPPHAAHPNVCLMKLFFNGKQNREELHPTHESKTCAIKTCPKLCLHNVLLYELLGSKRSEDYKSAGHISTLCKIAPHGPPVGGFVYWGSSRPKPQDHFFERCKPRKSITQTKAHIVQKNVNLFYSAIRERGVNVFLKCKCERSSLNH